MSGGKTRLAAERQLPPPDALRRRKCRRAYRRRMRRVGELALAVCDDDNEPSFWAWYIDGENNERVDTWTPKGGSRTVRRCSSGQLRTTSEQRAKDRSKAIVKWRPTPAEFFPKQRRRVSRADAQPLGRARTESPPARSGLGAASAVPTPEAPDLDQAGDAGQRLPPISV